MLTIELQCKREGGGGGGRDLILIAPVVCLFACVFICLFPCLFQRQRGIRNVTVERIPKWAKPEVLSPLTVDPNH